MQSNSLSWRVLRGGGHVIITRIVPPTPTTLTPQECYTYHVLRMMHDIF